MITVDCDIGNVHAHSRGLSGVHNIFTTIFNDLEIQKFFPGDF